MTITRADYPLGSPLTPREKEVLILVGKGFTTSEVGRLLGVGASTINDHLKAIYIRLDVSSRIEAAVWAAKQGWL